MLKHLEDDSEMRQDLLNEIKESGVLSVTSSGRMPNSVDCGNNLVSKYAQDKVKEDGEWVMIYSEATVGGYPEFLRRTNDRWEYDEVVTELVNSNEVFPPNEAKWLLLASEREMEFKEIAGAVRLSRWLKATLKWKPK
jgi:hypothetical protein